jgi:D-xylose 1-dehydrogenase (NADP+, D-xylono-1,5-lactone-forming)
MYCFHQRLRALVEHVQRAEIGDVRLVRSSFCFTLNDPTNYHHDPAKGGDALLDVGRYTVNITRWLLGEPVQALAQGTLEATGSISRSVIC